MSCSVRTARMMALGLVVVLIPALGLNAATPALFKVLDGAPVAPVTKKMQRARVMGVDSKSLIRQATDADSTIRLNLFADVSVDGIVESTRIDGTQGFVSRGRIVWSELSSFLFVVRGEALAGTVSIADRRFRVLSLPGAPGRVVVSELIPPQVPDCGCGKEHWVDRPAVARPAAVADDGSTIDVLVAYTQKALTAVGGAAQMNALIQLAIEESNTAYQSSNVIQRVRLVHKVQTNYNEATGFNPALEALTNASDGKMDELHALRDQYGADMVSLIIDNTQYCGLAWLMSTESHAFENRAFSVVHHDCATGYFSFSHELGHNMGLNHDVLNAGGGGVAPYAYGFRWVGNSGATWRSVMAYAPGTRVGQFSNPDVLYDGVATGTVSQENNARALNETYDTVANFRASILPGTPIITSPLTASGQPNEPFSYQIVATNSPTSFNATGLPAGLSVNTANGLISGTPTQNGDFNVTLSATNAVATGELLLKLKIGSSICGARTLVELNNVLRILSPVRLGQLDEALPTLRALRDKVLLPHPAGKKLVDSYYAQGPAMSRVLMDHEPLTRQALPLLVELLPQLQEGTRSNGRYQLSRDQYNRVMKLFDAVDQVATPELKGWLTDVRLLLIRAQRDANGEQVVLEIAQALQEP
ncbi:MAG: M12 family metallo-peptidase [Planctomycetaceae bacterium]|nr:M12 family metallo-peptidase [Planctomycetaceae bacterium]